MARLELKNMTYTYLAGTPVTRGGYGTFFLQDVYKKTILSVMSSLPYKILSKIILFSLHSLSRYFILLLIAEKQLHIVVFSFYNHKSALE